MGYNPLYYPALDLATTSLIVKMVNYIFPPAMLVYFCVAMYATVKFQQKQTRFEQLVHRERIFWATLSVNISYIFECMVLLVHVLLRKGWWPGDQAVVYTISSVVMWGAVQFCFIEYPGTAWYPYWGVWIMGILEESIIIILSGKSNITSPQREIFDFLELGLRCARLVVMFILPIFFWGFRRAQAAGEMAPLFSQNGAEYGTIVNVENKKQQDDNSEFFESEEAEEDVKIKEKVRERAKEGGLVEYLRPITDIMIPTMWPYKERWLQFRILIIGLCFLVQRGLNVMIPIETARITNKLMSPESGHFPMTEICILLGIRWLNSGSGVTALADYLWTPIEQYGYRRIIIKAYNHIISLSSDFHDNKSTSDLTNSINKAASLTYFMDLIIFSVLPNVGDLIVALSYFYITYGMYMAIVIGFVCGVYLWATSFLNRKKLALRRIISQTSRTESRLISQCMTGWETVTYFNRQQYEKDRYSEAILAWQKHQKHWLRSNIALKITQSAIFTSGLLCACFLAAYQVSLGKRKAGDFIALLSYWGQLSGPLTFFTTMFHRVQDFMLDAERIFEILMLKPSIATKPNAKDLTITQGEVCFQNVTFGYDTRRTILKDVSFRAPGGTTTALVGVSGGGKSTCLKLLVRLYDVADGGITIDGQDIRDVTLTSLREQIGVVPQDPRLFNESIMNNLKYARQDASDEDVYAACRGAAIHDKIMSFPDGYLTSVGEVAKLSGGEKQRIAIARAILKNPKIILLDEATSSVDVSTERSIQQEFRKLSEGRTMFIIAHRLTTIMQADQILVVDDGKIIERGTHEELLKSNGKYSQLWNDGHSFIQTSNSVATGEAKDNVDDMGEGLTNTTSSNIKFTPLTPRPKLTTSTSAPKLTYLSSETKENIGLVGSVTGGINLGTTKKPGQEKPIKHESVLKPEAKEFIPASIATKRTADLSTQTLPVDAQIKKPTDQKTITNPIEATCDEAPEQKNRRRRHRHRSRSSRSSSGNDHPSAGTESLIRQTMGSTGYAPTFGPDMANPYVKQHPQPTGAGIVSGRENLTQPELAPTRSLKDPKALHITDYSQQNLRTGLNETVPNIPMGTKRSSFSREGRGNSASRKPQGYGAANSTVNTSIPS